MICTYTNVELSEIAQVCSMAQITPVSITFGDTNVSIEFADKDDAVAFTGEYLGDSDGVSEYVP